MLVEYVKNNYYARFHNPSYHKNRETHFSISLDAKSLQSQWSVKCRLRVSVQGACL